MKKFKIEIYTKPSFFDGRAQGIKKDILDLGIKNVESVKYSQIYLLEGDIEKFSMEDIVHKLLIDPVTQDYCIITDGNVSDNEKTNEKTFVVEVYYKKGVTDAVGDTVKKGLDDLDMRGDFSARSGHKYVIEGDIEKGDIEHIAERLLSNKVVEDFFIS